MKVGQALKSKGGETYLKFEQDVVLKKGDALFLSRPVDDIDYLVKAGKLDKETAEQRKAKIPDFVIYNIKTANGKTTETVENTEKF